MIEKNQEIGTIEIIRTILIIPGITKTGIQADKDQDKITITGMEIITIITIGITITIKITKIKKFPRTK